MRQLTKPTLSTKISTMHDWISDCIFLAAVIKWYKTMHWWMMRTHLANTALQVDDWRNVETSECSNIQMLEYLNVQTFEKRNIWEKEEFGFSISILDLTSDLHRSAKDLDREISATRNFTNYSLSFREQIILCRSHKNCCATFREF